MLALPRERVSRILPLPNMWRPPATPDTLAGMIDYGGDAVPVMSLRALFGFPVGPDDIYRHVLLVMDPAAGGAIGLLVDRALDVVALGQPSPVAPEESLNGCIAGEVALGAGRLAHLLDPDRILLAQEQARLAQLRDAEASRLGIWESHGIGG